MFNIFIRFISCVFLIISIYKPAYSTNAANNSSNLGLIGSGTQNSGFGTNALSQMITGHGNSGYGYNALGQNNGTGNTAVGSWALYDNGSGDYNNAFGRRSLLANESGSSNMALGYQSLTSNTSGSNNVVMGHQSGFSNETGSGNIFIGYQSGYSETGSNKLYIDNTNTSSPLIYGDFDTDKVTINGDMSVTGNLTANKIVDTSGNTIIKTDSNTGGIHIGANSMVFYDSTSATGNGSDIMSSSVGNIQIGLNDTDTTTFKGNVHVPDPTASTHAASKRYVDSIGAISMAMNSSLTPRGNGNYLGFGTSIVDGQGAIATTFSFVNDKRLLNVAVGYNNLVNNPSLSGGISWKF